MNSLKKITGAFTLLILGIIGLVQFPNLFINKELTYKSFEIYSNDNIELTVSVKAVLDSVLSNIEQSPFQKDEFIYELYFVGDSFYEKVIRLFGMKNMASSKYEKQIYSAKPNFEKGILKRNDNEYEKLNLVQIISHECIHSQMYEDYSWFGIMQTPSWINEGYCEYISYRPIRAKENYNLSDVFVKLESNHDNWIRTEYNTMTPRQYVRDRLLIEYLIDVKGLEISEIISNENLTSTEVYEEIKTYY